MEQTKTPALSSATTIAPAPIPGDSYQDAKSHRERADDELEGPLPEGIIDKPEASLTASGVQQEQSARQATHGKHQGAWIGYRVEFEDPLTEEIIYRRTSRTPTTEEPWNITLGNEPIFERVKTYKARSSSDSGLPKSKAGAKRDADPPQALGPAISHRMLIYSAAIINALRSVVTYYPSQDLSGDVLRIDWPYRILVHHYDDLADFREQVNSKSPGDLCVRERDAVEHLNLLIQFLDDAVMSDIRAEAERNERGFATYEHFWYAYRPGCVVLTIFREDESSKWDAFVVQSVSGGPSAEDSEVWEIEGWNLDFDGTYLNRKRTRSLIFPFSGEEGFHSHTRFIPDRTKIDDEKAQEKIACGKRYWELIQKQCQHYKGKSCVFPHNEVRAPFTCT